MKGFRSRTIPLTLLSGICLLVYMYMFAFKGESKEYLHVPITITSIQDEARSRTYPSGLEDKTRVLAAARRIAESGKTLLISFINDAYLPFTYSWLCNTEEMGIHDQILIIVADKETEQSLKQKRPEISTVSINGFDMKGNQTYTRVGYVRIGIKRTQILNWILQDGIGLFLFEFDCLWVRNPVPMMTRFTRYDLVITPVAHRPGQVAIGFYYMSSTSRMKKLWQELTHRLTYLDNRLKMLSPGTVISEGENDQLYLTALIRRRYAAIRVKLLTLSQFPDGKWYRLPTEKRDMSKVFIINNNWVRGNLKKIKRAKKFGHWFLKEDGTCDKTQVSKIVRM